MQKYLKVFIQNLNTYSKVLKSIYTKSENYIYKTHSSSKTRIALAKQYLYDVSFRRS